MAHPELTKEVLAELRTKLEEERGVVEEELKHVGRVNPDNPADWEPTPQKMDIQEADRNEAADRIEGFEENTAIVKELEARLNNIKEALERIGTDAYGICEVGNEPIKIERLRANPAATTCVKHMREDE